jgi:hypothetical protein
MTMAWFPSKEFFEELRARANANSNLFKRLGTADMTLVVKIDYGDSSDCFEITFSGYRCAGVRHLASVADAPTGAIILSGPYSGWCEMIENIIANGHADLEHTLNTLTLFDTPLRIDAENQLDADLFYRYQQNLQEYFDGAGRHEVGAELPTAHR